MRRGGWAFRLPPHDGELLSSLLVRNAHAHGCSGYRFVNLLWPRRPAWNRDVDRNQDDAWLREIADHLGVPRERLGQATLADYAERLAGPGWARRGTVRLLLSAGILHRTRRRHGLQYCPACLAADRKPWYRKIWRVGFVLQCPEHGEPLRDACPVCDAPVIPHRSAVGHADHCHACGFPLVGELVPSAPEIPGSALRLQDKLLAVLETGTTRDPIGPWTGTEAFAGMRTLMMLASLQNYAPRIRRVLDLPPQAWPDGTEVRFEEARLPVRVSLMETVAALLERWPADFHDVAAELRLSQRFFRRWDVPPALAAEIARLGEGFTRDRRYEPVVYTPEMMRLRRRDPAAYRQARAARLLDACGRSSAGLPPKSRSPRTRKRYPPSDPGEDDA
ncbi:TniQ protein [Limimonas halophila]|uniref:TniQ protein n=1 Tax=Limimonas halophila TaxID=1082479 RepID=A0A1G7SRZ7_9PROT|nr:TniQ family protein [Limimonas halophila]SDG25867.1 TniQ protein [Limimonas halophila]